MLEKLKKLMIPDGELEKDMTVDNAYKARWVWYHTILAVELLCTNILLLALIVVTALD